MGGGAAKNLNQNNQHNHQYSKENIIEPQTIIEAKIVLLGDSGVGKSSIA